MKKANHKHEVQFAWTTHGHMEVRSPGVQDFLKMLKAVFLHLKNQNQMSTLSGGNGIFKKEI